MRQSDSTTPKNHDAPDIKIYADTIYFNYYAAGISLQFVLKQGCRPPCSVAELDRAKLTLDCIDIYNEQACTGTLFTSFPSFQLTSRNAAALSLRSTTTALELVQFMGEPKRKGGGKGPSSGSINIWCEWSQLGIMVEFSGHEARGPDAWERGKNAAWKILTVFTPSGPSSG